MTCNVFGGTLNLAQLNCCWLTGTVDESHDCAMCGARVESLGLSRPLTKSSCSLYDIDESRLVADMRVCNSCRCKSIHKRYMQ